LDEEVIAMSAKKADNLTVTGNGSAAGGTYDRAKIVGEYSVQGDLACEHLSVIGNLDVKGSLKTRRINLCGELKVRGDVASRALKAAGSIKVDGNYTAETLGIYGELAVEGTCEAERLDLRGVIVGGMLNAGTVDIRLFFGESKLKEIGGETIAVRRAGLLDWRRIMKPFLTGGERLSAETIEGDNIYLEHTKADAVRGTNVRIGPGCEIEWLEYRSEYKIDPRSSVKHFAKI
jgi:cytoskeletal protein CcmA (bactofilin family)